MIDCKNRESQISAFIDGELSESECTELLEHMSACEKCSGTYAALCAVSSAVKEPCVPPDELHEKIMTAVKSDAATKKPRKRAWISGVAAAAVVALVLLTLPKDADDLADSAASGSEMSVGVSSPEGQDESYVRNTPFVDSADDAANENTPVVLPPENDNVGGKETSVTLGNVTELSALLTPVQDEFLPEGDGDTVYEIYIETDGDTALYCTVTVIDSFVYADCGNGRYRAACTPEEFFALTGLEP